MTAIPINEDGFPLWTEREAREAQQAYEDEMRAAGIDPSTISKYQQPYEQHGALMMLVCYQHAYQNGDKGALMQAIWTCARGALLMPDWVAKAFCEGYRSVMRFEAGSWDAAFGAPFPKGMHLEKARIRHRAGLRVPEVMWRIFTKHPNTKIDANLFKRVGKECAVSATVAGEIWYELPQDIRDNWLRRWRAKPNSGK